MDQYPKVANIKKEKTDSTIPSRMKIPNEKEIKKKENVLVPSIIYIKTEPQTPKSELYVNTDTSYEMCHNYDVKIDMEKPIDNMDLFDESIQDPLNVGTQSKDKDCFSSDLQHSETRNQIKPINKEKEENLLENYEESAQTSRNKIHVCNVCKGTFKMKMDFDGHSCIHSDEKSFICTICKKPFSQKSNLDTHMLVHSGEKTHACSICNEVFTYKSHLNGHMLIHSDDKQYSCDVCNKSFKHQRNLVEHKRLHTNDKPYICDFCDKAFLRQTHLAQHRRLHTGEKPFSCHICKKLFAQKPGLNSHMKNYKH